MKTCLMCEHCRLSLGSNSYGEYTPGSPGDVACARGQFSSAESDCEAIFGTAQAWELLSRAERCPLFSLATWVKPGNPA